MLIFLSIYSGTVCITPLTPYLRAYKMSNKQEVTTAQLPDLLSDVLEAKLVPMIHGSPAIGKSDIGKQLAKKYNLFMIDVRLSQMDTVDLNGFPMMNAEAGLASYMPFDTFPTENTSIPEGYDGFLIFLDELNSAAHAVQAAAYKLILDRQVGMHNLHEKTAIIAAGNLATDKAIVNRMSTATQSRLVHFLLKVEPDAWQKWAAEHNIDHRIRSWIKFKPGCLHMFTPDHDDFTFPAPRTWEFLSRMISKYPLDIPKEKLPLMAGTVGEGAAREFYSYSKIFKTLLSIPQIIKDPTGVKVPEEPGTQYALAGSIGHHLTKKNLAPIITFLERMEPEMQILCVQGALKRDLTLMQEPSLTSWIDKYAAELF